MVVGVGGGLGVDLGGVLVVGLGGGLVVGVGVDTGTGFWVVLVLNIG